MNEPAIAQHDLPAQRLVASGKYDLLSDFDARTDMLPDQPVVHDHAPAHGRVGRRLELGMDDVAKTILDDFDHQIRAA